MEKAVNAVRSKELSQRQACQQYGVPRSTLQDRLSHRTSMGATPGRQTFFTKEEEQKLADYACNRSALGIGFSKSQFFRYVKDFANKLKKKDQVPIRKSRRSFKCTEKWWRSFRKQNPQIRLRLAEGTASVRHQCMDSWKVSSYFAALKTVLDEKKLINSPKHIWNMDETGIQLEHKAGKVIAARGSKHVQTRTSGNRELITVIAAVNAEGTALPPHMIPKGKTIKTINAFNTTEAPANTNWSVSDSGWTKQGIAKLWFTDTFLPNIGEARPQILILDGHDSHNFVELIDIAIQNKIEIIELPAHTSHWLQPCDKSLFGPLKRYYNQVCSELMSNYPGVVVKRSNFCGLFKQAWVKAMTPSNIMSGFRACGIYPFNPEAVPRSAFLPSTLYTSRPAETNCVATVIQEQDPTGNEPPVDTSKGTGVSAPGSVIDTNMNTPEATQPSPNHAENFSMDVSELLEVPGTPGNGTPEDETVGLRQVCPPDLALLAFECGLKRGQKELYLKRYENGYDLQHDKMYNTWNNLYEKVKSNSSVEALDQVPPEQETDNQALGFPKLLTPEQPVRDVNKDKNSPEESSTPDNTSAQAAPVFDLMDCMSATSANEVLPPEQALDILEKSLTEKQYHCFVYCRENKLDINQDKMFACWNKLRNLVNGQNTESMSITATNDTSEPSGRGSQDPPPTTEKVDDASATSQRTGQFPFNNSSFPGDGDNDVLPYPETVVRTSTSRRSVEKFFVLTSNEAYEYKVGQAKEKERKEMEKIERQNKRKEKQKEVKERQQKLKELKERKRAECAQGTAKKSREPVKNKENGDRVKRQKRQKVCHTQQQNQQPTVLREIPSASENLQSNDVDPIQYHCIFCNEAYREPIKETWIQCSVCLKWAHESCADLGTDNIYCCDLCKK